MAITFDHVNRHILIPVADANPVTVDTIRDACRVEEASEVGSMDENIVSNSGLAELSPGILTPLTMELINNWQVSFIGSGDVEVQEGNIIGGLAGDPFVHNAGIYMKYNVAQFGIVIETIRPLSEII